MKFSDNTGTTDQSVTMSGLETGRMNVAASSSAGHTFTGHTEQPAPVMEVERDDGLTTFFAVGVVVNVVMITAYFIWAYKQLNKTEARDE